MAEFVNRVELEKMPLARENRASKNKSRVRDARQYSRTVGTPQETRLR